MLIIGGTTGALVACVFIAAKFASDPGDILGFFGGAVGAGLAVIGAIWLEDRKSARSREDTKRILAQALISVGLSAHRFGNVPDVGIGAGILTFRQAVETFEVVRSHVTG